MAFSASGVIEILLQTGCWILRTVSPTVRTLDMRSARQSEKRADPELLTPEHAAWRKAVLDRAGYRCEAVEGGARCTVRAPSRLFADHRDERKDGGARYDVANGQCLCGRHHTIKTVEARARRMAERY